MEQYFESFITTLYKFLSDLDRYVPTKEIKDILDVYQKLPMGQISLRYYTIMEKYAKQIKNKTDESMFQKPLKILPNDVDISILWKKLSKNQKKKIWLYLEKLYKLCEIILIEKNEQPQPQPQTQPQTQTQQQPQPQPQTQTQTQTQTQSQTQTQELEFNPYEGIGSVIEEYGINEMFSGPDTLPSDKKSSGMGMGSMASLLGLNKMFDINKLRDQLKNMSKEDIDKATQNLQGLLGGNVSENTSGIISDMLSSIKNEIQNDKNLDDDPFDSIMRIAQNVATKLQPKIESGNVNMDELFKSTQGLTDNLKGSDGKGLFEGKTNPFDLVKKMMGNFMKGNKNPNQMSEQDCIQECNNMLGQMGMSRQSFNPQQPQYPQYPQQPQYPQNPQNPMMQPPLHFNRKMQRKLKKMKKKQRRKKK